MDKKREIELKPCPYCGGSDLRIGFNAVEERHYVVCSQGKGLTLWLSIDSRRPAFSICSPDGERSE